MLNKEKLKAFIPTRDSENAKSFYLGVLGLTLIYEDDFGMELDANGTILRISKVPEFTPYPFTVLGWVVDDVAAKVTQLIEKGVIFERYPYFEQDELGIWTAPSGTKVAWFKDPDGNLLSLND
jgi:catechol 2,3-dioxygenase-like lactoylglutathione lyase family enzyme